MTPPPQQMETAKKIVASDHDGMVRICDKDFIERIAQALSDEREKALSDAETVADIEHDEKCCSHEHCEYNCHAKGFNEASERITQAIRQLKGKS